MIRKVSDIAKRNLMEVDVLNGVRKIQNIFQVEGIECFVVYEEKRLDGIITKEELIGVHPNRIAADIMSHKYICVDYNMYIWKIKEIFDLNKEINIILIENEDRIIGYVTRTILDIELGKHIDLLTGLYKSDYMFYNAYDLIRSGKNTTIIFIDLNNFGNMNKLYGHINGDAILKSIGEILKDTLEPNSYLCRYAGDEFAIVTPYCIDDSRQLAEKIIKSIKSYTFLNNVPVSASIGITGCRMHNNKIKNTLALINKLVNIASLASTKAKQNVNSSIIIEDVDADVIA